ncbi:MAG: glycosyltransferase family 4 protein [Eubacteriales bacterium]|nr:glycosyltransferase family 4 protein [Eubacteriales bacterium]MDY4008338.1 glycosyltransferase family 4 protein [Candidatus Limiplasma sp.]
MRTQRMKIACVGYLHGRGGAERQLTMLANALSEKGHEVYLLSLAACNLKYNISDKVKLIDLSDSSRGKAVILQRFFKYKKALQEINPDVSIHFWLQSAYFTVGMGKHKYGKIIYAERGDPGDKEYSKLLKVIRNWALPHIDGFVFQSEGAKNYFDEAIQKKSVIIHNAVSVPNEICPFLGQRDKRIVSVGRLHPQKNHKLLINAFAQIADEIPDYTLEIYGDGELRDALQEQITRLDLKNRVFLKGSCADIFDRIRTAALFVLSSDYEGLPNALIEAMALGLPCISTDCRPGGAREIINNGFDGLIVPCNDTQALAKAIKKVICNDEFAKTLSARAPRNIRNFDKDRIYDEWEDFIVRGI